MSRAVFFFHMPMPETKQPGNQNGKNETIRASLSKTLINRAEITRIRDKLRQETQSLLNIQDAFKKFILVKDDIKPWQNEDGVIVMGALDFLLNPNSLDY